MMYCDLKYKTRRLRVCVEQRDGKDTEEIVGEEREKLYYGMTKGLIV